ncbi:Brain-specific serine protease 4 [Sarcoptes scabiei]|uniref:Brain-specific serine protease 4 n=1 Tax=Sarcoptes scabiei TaxID=52283 RepID=A0A834R6P2_SARSC|nr:Brain-specific serine protease 4 [Sarcoptes scabiei]
MRELMLMFSIISVSTNNNFSSILFHFSLLFLFTDPIETSGRCGYQLIKDNRKAKVVGGQDTYEGEFPWIVSVRKHGRHHCGGVIVGQKWILTAAHCVQSETIKDLMIRVGEYDLYNNEIYSRDYSIDQKFIHNNYTRINAVENFSISINNADIALLRTNHAIQWNEYTWPICIPSNDISESISISSKKISPISSSMSASSTKLGQTAIVVGWGKIEEKSHSHSDRLQKAELKIIKQEECSQWFQSSGRNFSIKKNVICAGYIQGGIDACHGDSGGPLLIKLQNGRKFLLDFSLFSTVFIKY